MLIMSREVGVDQAAAAVVAVVVCLCARRHLLPEVINYKLLGLNRLTCRVMA